MQMNHKGEIVTIAIVATFIILSSATLAASVLTQNKDTAFTSSSRAAEVSCYVGKACGIPACNDSMGGNSGSCSECNGGWCRGGTCANCGKGQPVKGGLGAGGSTAVCPGGKQANGKCKCRERTRTAVYCGGGTSFIDTFCDSCAPEKNCAETETCTGGNAQPAAQPTTAPADPAAQNPPPSSSGGTSSGTDTQPSSIPSATTTPTCTAHVHFLDSTNAKDVSGVNYSVIQGSKGGSGYTTNPLISFDGFTTGDVKIHAAKSGYTTVDYTSKITAPNCDMVVYMASETTTDSCIARGGTTAEADCKKTCSDANHYCDLDTVVGCYRCMERVSTPAPATTYFPLQIRNDSDHKVRIEKICVLDKSFGNAVCLLGRDNESPGYDLDVGKNYVNKTILTHYCSLAVNNNTDAKVWVTVSKQIPEKTINYGDSFDFSCGKGQAIVAVSLQK